MHASGIMASIRGHNKILRVKGIRESSTSSHEYNTQSSENKHIQLFKSDRQIMDSFPVKLHLPDQSRFGLTPYTPCVFEVIVPIGLPALIDPSLPAPPYVGSKALDSDLQRLVRPLMRAILSGLLKELLGSDYPICSLLGSDPDGNISESYREFECWDSKIVQSMADVDLEAGRWKDQFGEEGHGKIEAYIDRAGFGHSSLIFGLKYILVQGPTIPGGDDNPRAIQFQAEPALSDGKIVFHTQEYSGQGRKSFNNIVKNWFEPCKAGEEAGIPLNGMYSMF